MNSPAMPPPYIGLRPFAESERDRFFGRDREISILLDKIRANRLTLLLAASGVGKSSLLQAGIIPTLREDSNIELIYHRDWAASPQAFKQAVSEHYGEPHKDNVSLKSILRACTLFSSGQQIILLDQFEEFFNYQRFQAEFLPFIEELSAAILDRSLPASFVFSMREDFALELNSFKPFLPGVFDSYFRLEKLTRDQARLAIEEPLKPTGWRFEQYLLEEVLNDLAKREQERQFGVQELLNLNELPLLVEPPHLQIVCQELWQHHRDEAVKQITHAAYEQAGKTAGILNSYFLRKISSFNEKEQKIASAAFGHLIGQRATKIAHPLGRLSDLTGFKEQELKPVLEKLQEEFILRRQQRDKEFWYELYHDIFSESIDHWNREFKARQRVKRLATGSAAVLIAGGLLFAGNNWRANYYGRYLQLSPKESISDRIEVYRGAMAGQDIFHQRRFLHEVPFSRAEIEADKKFDRRIIEDKHSSQPDLIEKVPLAARIPLYMEDGLYAKGRELADSILYDNKEKNISSLPKHFVQMRTTASVAMLSKVLAKQKQSGAEPKKAVVAAFAGLNAVSEIVKLLADSDSNVRSAAASALGQMKVDMAVPKIIRLLTDNDSNVRSAAASALGQMKAYTAAPEIVKLLTDSDKDVRSAAVFALGQMKAYTAAPEIVKLLTDNDSAMQSAAALALGQLKAYTAAPEIVKLLTDANPAVRSAAALALGQLKTDTAVLEIIKLLVYQSDSSVDFVVQCEAASALVQLKAYTAVPEIVNLLADSNWHVRREAVKALGQLKAYTAAPEIVNLLTDNDSNVRREAVKALGQLKAYTAAPEIVKLLTDSDKDVRSAAVLALGQMKANTAVQEIVKLLTDNNWEMQSAAASALGQLKAESAAPEIVKLLTDSDSNVRSAAASALGQMKVDMAAPKIIRLLTDNDSNVQSAAASALGQLKAESAAPEIVKLLTDIDKDVRSVAVLALGQMKAESAVPDIVRLLTDNGSDESEIIRLLNEGFIEGYKDVRSAAASALGQLKAESAAPEIVRLLTDSNSDNVQLQAALALARMNHSSPQLQAWREQAFKEAQKKIAVSNFDERKESAQLLAPVFTEQAKIAVSNFDERKESAQLLAPVFTEQAATLLAQLIDDADQDVAQEAVKAIGFAAEFHPEWMSADKLLALLQHPDLDMRETAVTSLGQLISFRGEKKAADFSELDQRVRNALSSLINDQQQKTSIRLSAIGALGETGRKECAQILFELLRKFDRSKEESLHSRCLFWLGKMAYAPALSYMEHELNELEQAKAEWREQRDHNNNSGSIADKNDAWWQEKEYRIGSALARIDPEKRGIELLGHPLHQVRQGAVRALASRIADGKADAALIGKIIQAHQAFDPDNLPSPFPYTAFQAIDLALWNLEYTGKQEDVTTLQDIRAHLKPCRVPGQEGAIEERLEWTIKRLGEKYPHQTGEKNTEAHPQPARVSP